jgi:uroporphyrin-3 C-methyltransferase
VTEKRSKAEPEAPVTAAKSDNKTAENPSQSPLKKSGGGKSRWIKVLVTLIIVTAVTTLGLLGWTQWQKLVAADRVSKAAASFERFYQPIEQLYRQSEKRQSQRIEQLYNELSNMQLRLNAQGQRLAELGAITRSDWLLAEALYLIRLANQRLQTERSTKNPLALMENVDAILRQIEDPMLLPVRRALASDIGDLRLTGEIDSVGLFLELTTLADNIDQLTALNMVGESKVTETIELTIEEPSTTKEIVADVVQQLSQLVRVTHRQQPIEPLLLNSEVRVIKQNLRLMLEQAQSAVMAEEPEVYRVSLDKAERWVTQHFQLDDDAQVILQRLTSLKGRDIVQQLPQIGGSLAAIETFVALRQAQLSQAQRSGAQ